MTSGLRAALANLAKTLTASIVEAWTILGNATFGSYHPERHYMRGPGPKWHERHPGAPIA